MLKSLPFTKETRVASLVFFSFYFIYGMFRLPFAQYLVCIAIGSIVYGIFDSFELAAISLLLSHFAVPFFVRGSAHKEGFASGNSPRSGAERQGRGTEGFASGNSPRLSLSSGLVQSEGFIATNAIEISQRVSKMKSNLYGASEIRGVGSQMTEGFEDAKAADHTLDENKKESVNSKDVTASSKPAASDLVVTKDDGVTNGAVNTPENFQSQNGLFKLGQIPSDGKGGFHIDAGTTVMNALSALKPDQIAAMTKDTKQLIETQKSLMGLLQTFQPMMSEGKQMMETFQGMFGAAAGAGDTAKNMLGGK
jgi:hypothetical protein